jgi:hypothetical protein
LHASAKSGVGKEMSEMTEAAEASGELQSGGTRFTLSEGLMLFAVPVVAYVWSYVFEVGYAQALDIPVAFIRISLDQLLLVSAYVVVVVVGTALSVYLSGFSPWSGVRGAAAAFAGSAVSVLPLIGLLALSISSA